MLNKLAPLSTATLKKTPTQAWADSGVKSYSISFDDIELFVLTDEQDNVVTTLISSKDYFDDDVLDETKYQAVLFLEKLSLIPMVGFSDANDAFDTVYDMDVEDGKVAQTTKGDWVVIKMQNILEDKYTTIITHKTYKDIFLN